MLGITPFTSYDALSSCVILISSDGDEKLEATDTSLSVSWNQYYTLTDIGEGERGAVTFGYSCHFLNNISQSYFRFVLRALGFARRTST
jgi:hypothetical protein